ncbi:DinB family protein [Spirosoma pollinicola]|uniref:DinB family protein n=1 Tax=Spirosoma pollinicola TaxID=2057025 RepID=A0A2K8Z754_9BACT|nr:DinB family protein [Spirosoma pollinicola]AUD05701.1 DinB family protein [Spirosoma pollinicola]
MDEQKKAIQERLQADCHAFMEWANRLPGEQFAAKANSKWSVAEVLQHLYLSARPIIRLMTGPREVLSQWGPVETSSRSYNDIAVAYQIILETGAKAPAALSPRPEDVQVEKSEMGARFAGVYDALAAVLESWSISELDNYYVPHPVLGKLTVREMLYFTSIHTRHNLKLLALV